MSSPNLETGAAIDEDCNRMRWASRRGMLELDLMLGPFVEEEYPRLDKKDRQRYHDLMVCEDQQLFRWFMRREEPEDAELAAIVLKIHRYHASHASG